MSIWAPIRTRRNLFSHFDKGRDYFYLRTAIEIILLGYLLLQMFIIVHHALGIYPTLVRDKKSQIYIGTPSSYRTNTDEMVQLTATVIEALYTRTEKGTSEELMRPFVAKPIRDSVYGGKPPANAKDGFVQTAMLSRIVPYIASPVKFAAYAQVEFELNTFEKSYMDTGYFNLFFIQLPENRTPKNPAGWVLVGMKEMPKDLFLREQERLFPKDAENEAQGEQKLLDLSY